MADLSLVEFIVYGFFAYSGMLMLILQVIKEAPSEKSHSIIRSIYLIPCVVAAFLIGSSGDTLVVQDFTNTIIAVNTTEHFTEDINATITLQAATWLTFHFFLGIIMLVYVFTQLITLFTKIK